MTAPRLHHTPKEAFGNRVRESVVLGGRDFLLDRPERLDLVFDHPQVRAAYDSDCYIPFWCDLWPAAQMLAREILDEPWDLPRQGHALEIGCGLGLSGIVALSRGLKVTFSDIDLGACQLAADNAALNGFTDSPILALDFRAPPRNLSFPVIFGADVLYEDFMTEAAAQFLICHLPHDGLALIADPDRVSARPFRSMLERAGLQVKLKPKKVGPHGSKTKGVVYRITRETR